MGQLSSSGKSWGLPALLFLTCWGILALGFHHFLTSRRAVLIWDFAPLWSGARALFLEGRSPYDQEVTLRTMQESYGRPARSGEDPRAFSYPLYALYLVAPLVWMPRSWAQAFWMASLLEVFLSGSLVVWRVWHRPSQGWQAGLFLVGLLFLYPVTWALLLGQMSVWAFAFVAFTIWALQREKDLWAGGYLALSTMKPHLVALFVPVVLIWSAKQRRWDVWRAFGFMLFVLVVSGWVLLPRWPWDFLQALQRYAQHRPFVPPLWMMWEALLPAGVSPAYLVSLMALSLGWLVWVGRMKDPRAWPPVAAFTLVLTFLVAPRAHLADQVLLVYPLWGVFWKPEKPNSLFRGLFQGSFLGLLAGYWMVHGRWLTDIALPSLTKEMFQHRVLSPLLPGLLLGTWLYLFLRWRGAHPVR